MTQELRNLFTNLCSPLKESVSFSYFPVLRFTGLDMDSTLILSYVLGWNFSNRQCFISIEKIANMYQMSKKEVKDIISVLVDNEYIYFNEVPFNGTKAKAFNVDFEKVVNEIISNEEYKRLKEIHILTENLELLKSGKSIPQEKQEDSQQSELEELLKATRKKINK